ncbi:MAG: hypothetical protein M5U34_10260 [Chloroflexi bacterium]|nr:hypothetical protein [Chloroflexota bacterium]
MQKFMRQPVRQKNALFSVEQMKVAHVFDSRTLSFASEIMTLTNGEGIDIVLNTLSGAGIAKSLRCCVPRPFFWN